MLRMTMLAFALLLSGCASPGTTEDLSSDAPDRLTRQHVVWNDATVRQSCRIEPCILPLPAVPEPRPLDGVGSHLWLNVTWTSFDDRTRELLLVVQVAGEEFRVQGPSPLTFHLPATNDTRVLVGVQAPPRDVASDRGPPAEQPFEVQASYFPPLDQAR